MDYSIGIDLGGTKIEGILMSRDGNILKRYRVKTEANKSSKVVINNVIKVINKLKTKKILGIGVGTPGFRRRDGKLSLIKNIPSLNSLDLKDILEKKTKERVLIENDANCFALAENSYGAGKNVRYMVGLIIGTGIGGGIIAAGRLYHGYNRAAGEFGHMTVDASSDFQCSCSLKGDFEALCSGPNIVKRYRKYGGKNRKIIPSEIFKSNETAALAAKNETYKYLGIGIAGIISSINPEVIVLGGGVSNSINTKKLRNEIKKHIPSGIGKNFKIVKNKLGDSSGVIGAAQLVFH